MSNKSKEFQIVLDEYKTFIPGDEIKGNVVVQSSRSIDVQNITLCFKCYAEIQGDRKVLLDNTLILATQKTGKSSSNTLASGKTHSFPFSLPIPEDLPSTLKIPKMASVTYTLTATHKKPLFKLSSTLPTQMQGVEVTRPIDINSDNCRNEKKSNTQFGHLISSSETEWSTIIPRTGFLRGDSIPVEIDIRHFPPFKKTEAIKVTLIRLVSKTEPFKTVEKKALSSKIIDLDTKKEPSQTIIVNLDVPINTPSSLFPPNGQIMSIQYMIESELYLKNVKKAFITAKKIYTHENVIIIGTMPKEDTLPPQVNPRMSYSMNTPVPSFPVRRLEKKMSLLSTTNSVMSSSRGSVMSSSRGSIMMQNDSFETLKPLKRLDEEAPMKYTYNKRRPTKEELPKSSEICLPTMIQEEENIPSLPMLVEEHTDSNEITKPFDPHTAPVHQDSFQSYDSSEPRSPQTPGPPSYFDNSTRPPIHPLYSPHRSSLQDREQSTGISIPHEYSREETAAKHIPRMSTPELSRNNTLSTVSTQSTVDHLQRRPIGRN